MRGTVSPASAADGHGLPGMTAAVNGPGLATVTVNGAQTLAVWADGSVLPLAQAARRGVTGAGAAAGAGGPPVRSRGHSPGFRPGGAVRLGPLVRRLAGRGT